MPAHVLNETLTAASKSTAWFRNPASANNNPQRFASAGVVPGATGFDSGELKLEAAIVDPKTDPNDAETAPAAAAIQEISDVVFDAASPGPQNLSSVLPWLRFTATGANPDLDVWVY